MKKTVKKIAELIVPLLAAALTALLVVTEPFYDLDSMLCDAVYSQMNGTGDEIVIVAIDEETLAEYGAFSEWSREKCAQLADFLYSDEENNPAVLAFDIVFSGETDEESDNHLVKSLSGHNAVTATNFVYRGTTIYADGAQNYDAWNIEMEERPFAALDNVVNSGFANAQLSRDGFVRSAQLWEDFKGEKRYSFAAQIYEQYQKSLGKEAAFPQTNSRNQVLFGYSGKPGEFQHFSLKDVLSGSVDKRNFKDKIVMVGAYATGMQDSFHTPADRARDMFGVELNANIVRALIMGKTSQRAPALVHAVIAALLVFIYVFTARKMKMYPALLSVIWLIIADFGAGFILSRCGITITLIYPLIVAGVFAAAIFVEKYIAEIMRKKQILQSFEKYLAPQVIKQLSKDEEYDFTLGVEKREVCVLFVDIRGFTTMSEKLAPEEVSQILNEFLSEVTKCVFRHSGMLDKFIGDAAMAVFNAPTDLDDYLFKAVCAAVDIKNCGEMLGKRLQERYGNSVNFGIGLNCGEAVVGNIGCEIRMDYTAIGDTVNTAARLEAKAAGGEILISEALYEQLKDRIDARFKEEMTLKGKALPVKVYSVLGVKNEEFAVQ